MPCAFLGLITVMVDLEKAMVKCCRGEKTSLTTVTDLKVSLLKDRGVRFMHICYTDKSYSICNCSTQTQTACELPSMWLSFPPFVLNFKWFKTSKMDLLLLGIQIQDLEFPNFFPFLQKKEAKVLLHLVNLYFYCSLCLVYNSRIQSIVLL